MGNVPTYSRRELPPGFSGQAGPTGGQISQIAGESLAMGQFGSGLSQTAAAIFQELKQQKDASDLTNTNIEMMQTLTDLDNKYALDTDYGTIETRWQKEVEGAQKGMLGGKRFSPAVQNRLKESFGRMKVAYGDRLAGYARNQRTQQERARFFASLDTLQRTGADDPFTEGVAIVLIRKTLGQKDIITPEEAQELESKVPANLDIEQVYGLANEGRFDAAYSVINASKALQEKEKSALTHHLDILKRASQEQEKVNGDAYQKDVMRRGWEASNLAPVERAKAYQVLRLELTDPNSPVTGEQARVLTNWLDSLVAPAAIETDWLKYDEARKDLIRYRKGDISREQMMKVFTDVTPNLSEVDKRAFGNDIFSVAESEAKKDDIRKNPKFTRIIDALNDSKSRIWFTPTRDNLTAEQQERFDALDAAQQQPYLEAIAAKELYKTENDFWQYAAQNPEAKDEDLEQWLDKRFELPKKAAAKGLLSRMWTAYWATGIERPATEKRAYFKTATNPKTGERMGYDGTKWEKIP